MLWVGGVLFAGGVTIAMWISLRYGEMVFNLPFVLLALTGAGSPRKPAGEDLGPDRGFGGRYKPWYRRSETREPEEAQNACGIST